MSSVLKTLALATVAAGALAIAPIAANAVTVAVTENGITPAVGDGTSGNAYSVGNGDLFHVVLTTTTANEVIDNTLYFQNNSSETSLLSFASVIPTGSFTDPSVEYSLDGTNFFGVPIGSSTQLTVASGATVRFRAQGTGTQIGAALDYTLAPVPVPATGLLLLGGIGAFGALRRRKKHAAA